MKSLLEIVVRPAEAPRRGRKEERGAVGGLPEAGVVIAVGMALGAIALAGGVSLMTDSNVQGAISELTSFQIRMRNAHAASGSDYGSAAIPSADIIQAGYAPGSMISGTTLQSRWRSAIAVTGAGSTFLIEIPGVPQEDCIALLQQIQPPVAISARAAATSGGLSGAAVITLPATRAAALTACGTATNAVELTME